VSRSRERPDVTTGSLSDGRVPAIRRSRLRLRDYELSRHRSHRAGYVDRRGPARAGRDGQGAALGHDRSDHALRISDRSEEHTSELQSLAYLVCRLLLEKKKTQK